MENIKNKLATKSRTQWENLIDEWVHNEKDRHILKRRLLDGINFEELAEEVDLSTQQTKNRTYKSQTTLFSHL